MSASLRLAAFAGLLAAVVGVALLVGGATDPGRVIDDSTAAAPQAHGGEEEGSKMDSHSTPAVDKPRGLAVADGGLRLVPRRTELARGREGRFAFTIEDAGGRVIDDFDLEHERRMHVIVVRRDLTGYQHLHPRRAADGSWEVGLRLPDAGSYRVFADFSRDGTPYTLGADLTAPGDFDPEPLPAPATEAAAGDGYSVTSREEGGELRFTVRKDGRVLDDVEPYLGARGHLVALREGDLAFLHVHPIDEATEGREVRFAVEYPSTGRYRLFLQFKHDGRVRTAAFTRASGGAGAPADEGEHTRKEAADGHGH